MYFLKPRKSPHLLIGAKIFTGRAFETPVKPRLESGVGKQAQGCHVPDQGPVILRRLAMRSSADMFLLTLSPCMRQTATRSSMNATFPCKIYRWSDSQSELMMFSR